MARELKIYGRTYELTVGVENYAKVREEFEELAWNYGKLYVKDIEKPGLSMAALIKNGYEAAEKYFEKAADDVLDRLAEHGVYTVKHQDIECMAEQYGVLDAFDKGFYAVAEAYYKIVGRAEEEKLQRQIRKESRGRVVGGGFGLKGAAQGMIQAGLLNGVTGLGHSIFNAIGNARTEREKRERLDALYPVAYGVLQNAFKASVSNYYLLLVSLLDEFGIFEFELPAEQDKELAKALLENLSAGRVPKDMLDEILYEIVTLNPYQIESYEYILENYGDKKNELEKFAKAHGISIASIKDVIFDDMFFSDVMDLCDDDEIKKDPVKYEKKLVALQNKMEKQKKKMSFAGETECEGIIKKELKTLSENYKTIDGVVFETMEEANATWKDLETSNSENVSERKKDIALLNVKSLAKHDSWRLAMFCYDKIKEYACVNDNSSEFKALLNKAKQYWDCAFENEIVYFVLVDGATGGSVVLTSERCYIDGKVGSVKQKYIFPVDKVRIFRGEGKKQKYLLFFDVEYFKQYYFDCSDGCVCFNTVDFNIFNIPEKAGEEICRMLTLLLQEIRRPLLEKEEKREQFEREIAETWDVPELKKLISGLEKDRVLDDADKQKFLSIVQVKLDKRINEEENKKNTEQLLAEIKKDDIKQINSALKMMLQGEIYDENDKDVITKLIDMQLNVGESLYGRELNKFFKEGGASLLIKDRPVYTYCNKNETAKELCKLFTTVQLELEEDEIPLVLFRNICRRKVFGGAFGDNTPVADICLISNKRLMVVIEEEVYVSPALGDLVITQDDILHSWYIHDKKGNPIPFEFPYVERAAISDKAERRMFIRSLWDSETAIVAKELNRFITGIIERNAEIKKGVARPVELSKTSVASKPSAEETPKSGSVEEKPKVICMEETEKKASMAVPKCSVSEMAEFIDRCPKLKKGVFISRTDYDFWKKLKKILKRCEGKVKEEDVFALFIQREDEKIKEGMIFTTKGIVKKQRSDFAVMTFAYSDIIGFSMLHSNVIANYTSMHIVMPQGPQMIAGLLGKEGSKELANRIIAIVMHLYGLEMVPYSIEESMYENKLW